MLIQGFQKLTLLDYPGKTACTIFTGGCNFRCPFCHNALLVTDLDPSTAIDQEEVLSFLKKRQGLLDGVCVTGGEPLLQPDLPEFLRQIKDLGYRIKLDTNGSSPQKLKALVAEGLIDYVAMDVKNCREKYGLTVGIPDYDIAPIEESVAFLTSGAIDFEFRTTVVQEYHTPQDIGALAEWIQDAEKYFLQNFVDSGHLIGDNLHPVDIQIMENMRQIAKKWIPNTELRGV